MNAGTRFIFIADSEITPLYMLSSTPGSEAMTSPMRPCRNVLSTSVDIFTAREPSAIGIAVRTRRAVVALLGIGRGESLSISSDMPSPFFLW